MLFSTRDNSLNISYEEAIIKGISDDNGLFVIKDFPSIDLERSIFSNASYQTVAKAVLSSLLSDWDEQKIAKIVDEAYNDKFDNDQIVPIKTIDNQHFLELYHGPTLAFKDMALSILPHLLKTSVELTKLNKKIVILTATSGDTGKAALEGFGGINGIDIFVFYPMNGVSDIQKKQMITQSESNTHVFGIDGNFDNAQSAVKEIFTNPAFNEILESNEYTFSSANSINIGRLIPQIIYYFYGYFKLVDQEIIQLGETINVSVPTGNFGNILAAKYAKLMGLPINKFICASNKNNVLTDFFNTQEYRIDRDFYQTISPSMDILISSNLERLLFYAAEGDSELVSTLMDDLKHKKAYTLPEPMKKHLEDFYGNYASEEETKQAINKVFTDYGYLIDPHTAVAYHAHNTYQEATKDTNHTLIASTASPYKFPNAVADALTLEKKTDVFKTLRAIAEKTSTTVPPQILDLTSKEIIHDQNIEIAQMEQQILNALNITKKTLK